MYRLLVWVWLAVRWLSVEMGGILQMGIIRVNE